MQLKPGTAGAGLSGATEVLVSFDPTATYGESVGNIHLHLQ